MMKFNLANVPMKKVGRYVAYGVTAIAAVATAINDKKKEEEFEQMKEIVKKLQDKE